MPRRSQRLRLLDMQFQLAAIRTAMQGQDLAALQGNWLLRNAVERGLEIVSEASRHLDPALTAHYPAVPWRRVADIGNWLRHAYEQVDPALLLAVIIDHFPAIEAAVAAMLDELPED